MSRGSWWSVMDKDLTAQYFGHVMVCPTWYFSLEIEGSTWTGIIGSEERGYERGKWVESVFPLLLLLCY